MRKLILVILAVAAAYYAYTQQVRRAEPVVEQATNGEPAIVASSPPAAESESGDILRRAFENQQSNLQTEATGEVAKLLSDDNAGSKHQRFVVKLASGQTVLVAHNIDLAPRVPLAVGDPVTVYGEYEWNDKGGVMHWTHNDPAGQHIAGWIKHRGKTYQ